MAEHEAAAHRKREAANMRAILSEFAPLAFKPERYTDDLFARHTEDEAKERLRSLHTHLRVTTRQLQGKVYQVYPQFIAASKEISNMEEGMASIHNLLEEYRSLLKGMEEDLDAPDGGGLGGDVAAGQPRGRSSTILRRVETAGRGRARHGAGGRAGAGAGGTRELPRLDDLDVLVSERNFAAAVAQVGELRKRLAALGTHRKRQALEDGLQQRVLVLSDVLLFDLHQNTTLSKSEQRSIVACLVELGLESRARDTFLQRCSDEMERRVHELKMRGDVVLYVGELSHVVFSSIKSTCDVYRSLFRDVQSLSSFVHWSLLELEHFVQLFSSQVFDGDTFQPEHFRQMVKCMGTVQMYCSELRKQGLSYWDHITALLREHVVAFISAYYARLGESLEKRLRNEVWKAQELFVYDPLKHKEERGAPTTRVQLTDSGKHLYSITQRFISDVSPILKLPVYADVVAGMAHLFRTYIAMARVQLDNPDVLPERRDAGFASFRTLTTDLLPRIITEMERKLKRPMVELVDLQRELTEQIQRR